MHAKSITEEYLLPQVEALLAGTLALMTGLAQGGERCAQRELMQAKVHANLSELAVHPHVSESLRGVLARLVHHWGAAPVAAEGGQERVHMSAPSHLLH